MLAADREQRARTGAVISYNELAREYGQPRVTPENWHSHPFFGPFGLMDDEDISKGLPLRTALVYSKVLNRPPQIISHFGREPRTNNFGIQSGRRMDRGAREAAKRYGSL